MRSLLQNPWLASAAASGALLGAGALIPGGYAPTLYIAAVVAGGLPAARSALISLRRLRVDMNVLLVVAVAGAGAIGAWNEAAAVVFLFSVGEALEHFAFERMRGSVRALAGLIPETALVLRAGGAVEVHAGDVKVGEVVVARPGERIPLDGVVLEGSSEVNEAPITGSPPRWRRCRAAGCSPGA